jgi:formate dehydrogenase major subunit
LKIKVQDKMTETLNIVLNGKILKGIPGETILEFARRHNVHIPTLCNDPRLEPFSSCYLCVVEIEGVRGLQPACSTKIAEGFRIETENERIKKSRKTALDLLAGNHYADCVAPCRETCPAGVDVQGYISLIEKGLYSEAVALIKEVNPLPAICGRVCVRPCEAACRRNFLGEGSGVGIDYLKRFTSDIDLVSPKRFIPKPAIPTGKKAAIIGAGPGGLSCAYFLQQKGHQCDIYESAPAAGGWLRYGIPEYRLPNDIIDKEVAAVTELGTKIFYNNTFGKDIHYNDLKKDYDAVILTIGSQRGTLLGCEGEEAGNVFSGIDFLRNMEMTGQRYDFSGKTVAVVGGGNTAMDCCRTSVRCGADKVYVIYRRTEKEMPANPIEIHESKLEGVEYMFLTNPKKVNKDNEGNVESITCLRMELGEPDASGRRRPVPVEGSEFDVKMDYILAAIGQKTNVNFLDDVNSSSQNGQLKVNRWGDIDCNRETLQTGIPSMFAAGDGVSGPATIIEAIAQAKIAARSCHQYLSGEPIVPVKKEFLSKKDNFKEQHPDSYLGRYQQQFRHEMPTIDPSDRLNFNEVEMGYENAEVALKESQRCLECGCVEYFTCELKKYSTEYGAEQKRFEGEFKSYEIDFSHPFVEIDNNKCILCSRCIRICKEVVGANALGLINRGFSTYVAPTMEKSLAETTCESCGLCIETCPTAAITENVPFKPGPLKLDTIDTVDNMGPEGFEISLHHKAGFFMAAKGRTGDVNRDGNISRQAKFGYKYLNDPDRILQPMLKINGKFEPIGFHDAIKLIIEKIKSVDPDKNVFFAGSRLTNEEIYLIQKLARAGVKTNNVNCFQYLGRGFGYGMNAMLSTPFEHVKQASRIYIFGSGLNMDYPLVNHIIFNARHRYSVPVELITNVKNSGMEHKVDKVHHIKSYYHFVKAVNYFLLSEGLQNDLYLKGRTKGFDEYKKAILAEDFDEHFESCGTKCMEGLAQFAKDFNKERNAILIFPEKDISSNTSFELHNLAMITGKLGKSAQGILALKEKNNSQGIIDMGGCHKVAPGFQQYEMPEVVEKLKNRWGIADLPTLTHSPYRLLIEDQLKNAFIFGEDPVGCAINPDTVQSWFKSIDFLVVQDYFMTKTAQNADLVLPASLPFEIGGSFTTTQRRLQKFEKQIESTVELSSPQQLIALMKGFGLNGIEDTEDVLSEFFTLLPPPINKEKIVFDFHHTEKDNYNLMFKHGCDIVNKRFDDEFDRAFSTER